MEGPKRRKPRAVTLMDVLKAHGMRVVEGTKLNMVNKGIETIGVIVASVARSTTCAYLSQNNLSSLAGIEQLANLKMLSLGSNTVGDFDDVARLGVLPHLRTLYLVGNPVCDAPNYRARVLALLPQLAVLDTTDVSAKERQLAPFLAAQDANLRRLVHENHADITRLEWIVQRIPLHREFFELLWGSAPLPPLDKVAVNVELLLRLWKQHQDPWPDHAAVELRLRRVVARAYERLLQHPIRKAKALLQKFGPAAQDRLKALATPTTPSWEEAYASVIALQQNTIAKLRGLCERNRRELVDAMKGLLVKDARRRPIAAPREPEERASPPEAEAKPAGGRRDDVRCGDFPNMTLGEAVSRFEFRHLDAAPASKRPPSPRRKASSRDRGIEDDAIAEREAMMRLQMQLLQQSLQERDAREAGEQRERALQMQLLEYEHQIRRLAPVRREDNAASPEAVARFAPEPVNSSDDEEPAPPLAETALNAPTHARGRVPRAVTSATLGANGKPLERLGQRRPTDTPPSTDVSGASVEAVALSSRVVDSRSSSWQHRHSYRSPLRNAGKDNSGAFPRDSCYSSTRQETFCIPTCASPRRSRAPSDCDAKCWQEAPKMLLSEIPSAAPQLVPRHMLRRPEPTAYASRSDSVGGLAAHHEAPHLWLVRLRRLVGRWRSHCALRRRVAAQGDRALRHRAARLLDAWRLHTGHCAQVRALQQRRLGHLVACCFERWTNAGRFGTIAKYAAERRIHARLCRILRRWRSFARQAATLSRAAVNRLLHINGRQLRTAFGAWRHVVIVVQLHRRHRRHVQRSHDRLLASKCLQLWYSYTQSRLQPRRDKERSATSTLSRRVLRQAWAAWKRLQHAAIYAASARRRRAWRCWQRFHQARLEVAHLALKTTRFRLRKLVTRWVDATAAQRAQSRAATVAGRFATTHAIKRAWRGWTVYATRRQAFVRGALKALKHHRAKLLRRLWAGWAAAAALNLRQRRAHKQVTLRKVLFALRHAVFIARERRRQVHNQAKLVARQNSRLVDGAWQRWRRFAVVRRRTHGCIGLLRLLRAQTQRARCWARWSARHASVRSAQMAQLEAATREADAAVVVAECREEALEAAQAAMTADLARLEDEGRAKDRRVADLLQLCDAKDAAVAQLQAEAAGARDEVAQLEQRLRLQAAAHAREAAEMDVAVSSHVQDVERLQRMLLDVKTELLATQKHVQREKEAAARLAEQVGVSQRRIAELESAVEVAKAEARTADDRLATERAERHDAAVRCQAYEARLAQTCRDIHTREEDMDQELARAQAAAFDSDQRRQASDARNAELLQLLQEKNAQTAALTATVEALRTAEARRMGDLLNDVQASMAQPARRSPRSNQAEHELHRLDVHARSVHDDIRSLQDKLLQRLHQAPLHANAPRAPTPPRPKRKLKPKAAAVAKKS
ncbi:hypothetical protein ACHHYP_00413 [Achlya hypogyna]|uniref:U2A'/phosphoprotein 32 family A C-terminal domain-containing protein n=1 Tax=Achlya hypogyna TaxID=1202772 RepID=A0A1V9ZV47_ACHHY|nr:hypothetical protein ACHHYP_00413 [Achlya hypogyna]